MPKKFMSLLLLVIVSCAALTAVAVAKTSSSASHTVSLNGPSDVPKGAPKGHGSFTYRIVSAKSELCYSLSWSGIGTPLAAHVHEGLKGIAGPIVIVLANKPPVPHGGCVKASKSVLRTIAAHPSQYYVNVHTAKYPGGAIRGQL